MTAPPAITGPSYLVRHGAMRFLGVFAASTEYAFRRGEPVVLKTDRGLEVGDPLAAATPQAVANVPDPTTGEIVRAATADDRAKLAQLADLQAKEFAAAEQLIAKHKLAMQLVDIEHLFGGERIVFYFLAESRVDFRELVKSMAREFHTRIELRQIGARDEAKLLADYGDCGKPVCCNTHLSRLPPVSMKMAKVQKSTLDPSKISGRCGRLKCCLRYEFDTYKELERDLPPVGARVETQRGKGRVLALETLAGKVVVELEDGRRMILDPSEIERLDHRDRGRVLDEAEPRGSPSEDETNDEMGGEFAR